MADRAGRELVVRWSRGGGGRVVRVDRVEVLKLVVLFYEFGAFLAGRALVNRYPYSRVWLFIGAMLLLAAGAAAVLWLPGYVPDRPTPVLMVVYYGLYLVAAALGLLGLPFLVAAILPTRRTPRITQTQG